MDVAKKKLALYGTAGQEPKRTLYCADIYLVPDLLLINIDNSLAIQELACRGVMRRYLLASGK